MTVREHIAAYLDGRLDRGTAATVEAALLDPDTAAILSHELMLRELRRAKRQAPLVGSKALSVFGSPSLDRILRVAPLKLMPKLRSGLSVARSPFRWIRRTHQRGRRLTASYLEWHRFVLRVWR